jgi:hypothetical protein
LRPRGNRSSAQDVDQVPHLKGTPYLTRMVDNHPIRDPLKVKDILKFLHFGQTEDQVEICSIWQKYSDNDCKEESERMGVIEFL